ncbi:hypothetical protein [Synechococcus sp. GFB01]|uniref:hypothetical protein n=1 Tax=Synechococcus sp. GFB01 TaxID=1662190 RepID=UPI001F47F465|nr:hypothetical protein [Synechococcus sp. GFB01]
MTKPLMPRFIAYGRRYLWPLFSLALLLNVLYSASTGFVPLVIRFLFDDILPSRDRGSLYLAPAAIVGVIACGACPNSWALTSPNRWASGSRRICVPTWRPRCSSFPRPMWIVTPPPCWCRGC